MELGITSKDAAKSLGHLVIRAQFPRKLPPDLMTKFQDTLNRIRNRVDSTNVDYLTRKPIESLGVDLNNIADALVEHVRQSPDGIYTDYLKANVDNISLEDALYNVGLQLKAYQTDLTNYQMLVSWLMSLPAVPVVTSSMVGALTYNWMDVFKSN